MSRRCVHRDLAPPRPSETIEEYFDRVRAYLTPADFKRVLNLLREA